MLLLDFITTTIGVWQRNFYELNPLTNAFYKANAFYPFFIYLLIIVPVTAFGLINLFTTEKMKNIMLFVLVIEWSFVVSSNILQLVYM